MANSNNDFNNTVSSLFKGMDQFISSKSVIGEPIQVGDVTIIPLSDVNFGVAAGAAQSSKGANNAAGGMGGKLSPTAIIVIKDGYAQILPTNQAPSTLNRVIDMIPGVADKVKAKILKKEPTAKEMDQVAEVAENLGDKEF